jgi:hypothetical protein
MSPKRAPPNTEVRGFPLGYCYLTTVFCYKAIAYA